MEEYLFDFGCDRQLDSGRGAEFDGDSGGIDALSHTLTLGEYILERPSFGKLYSECAVTAQRARRGKHKVSHPSQSRKSVRVGSQLFTQPRGFRQPPGNERRSRIMAKVQAIQHARRDRHDILEGSSQLYANRVGARIDPKIRVGKCSLDDFRGD